MEKTLLELAEHVNGKVLGDPKVRVRGLAPILEAADGDITFVNNRKYVGHLRSTKASAVVVSPDVPVGAGNFIVCDNPYLAFARIASLLCEPPPAPAVGVDPRAAIHPRARIGDKVSIGPFVTVEADCRVGDRVTLMPAAYLGHGVEVGEDSVLHPNVAVYHGCRIGRRVTLHANVVIGSDGFGFAPDGERYEKIPQLRRVVIGDDVSIGANTTVNRGALRDTIIGEGCKIDSSCVISHGVQVGPHTLIVSQVGISGSVTVGRHVTLAGQAGVAGHLNVGDNVVGGCSPASRAIWRRAAPTWEARPVGSRRRGGSRRP